MSESGHGPLRRELGVFGATMMGLGSVLGTGVFVSLGIGAGVGGPSVLLAVGLAALVALCNALSSAQLAASHPVSGGTYEYGYTYLSPWLGFSAGWMFLCAKGASAATAGLGFAGYLLHATDLAGAEAVAPVGVATVLLLTGVVSLGIRRSSRANTVIVSVTLLSLLAFVVAGAPSLLRDGGRNLSPFFGGGGTGLLEACALMFVAYTGYGRVATMGEEVRDPRRVIPRAILCTLGMSALLYVLVGLVAVGSAGAGAVFEATAGRAAPLETVARGFDWAGVHWLVAVGAMTAMLGVLLNLLLGLSRVLLAMGRRRDMPAVLGRVSASGATPRPAVLVVGLLVAALASVGSIRLAWSFSAFTVLVYYAITNLACLRLPREHQLYPRVFAWSGLAACAGLAFWVERRAWIAGVVLLGVGFVWHVAAGRGTRASDGRR